MPTGPRNHRPAAPARPGPRRPSVVGVVGTLLLVTGLSCLGWVGYQLLGTDVVAHRAYTEQTRALQSAWSSGPAPTPGSAGPAATPSGPVRPPGSPEVPGAAVALLRVPRFGAGYEVPVVAGTGTDDLAHGVGHYPGTAEPGAVGNFALAGHRITHGQPFAQLLTLRPGDQVVVETRTAVLTYVMDTSPADLTVPDTAGWVLDPVPHQPGAVPTRALITLTTCQDLFHSPDRSVGFGHLESSRPK